MLSQLWIVPAGVCFNLLPKGEESGKVGNPLFHLGWRGNRHSLPPIIEVEREIDRLHIHDAYLLGWVGF
jgi:hypothetical protein